MLVAGELHACVLELPSTLDEYLAMSVHHDLRDRFVVQKRLDRSVAEHVVDDAGDQELPFLRRDPFLRAS